MKARAKTAFLIVFALAALVFGALWQRAAHDDTDIRLLAQSAAAEACDRFDSYCSLGTESDYWGGTAGFYAFMQAYRLLSDGTPQASNASLCSEVYGMLLLHPERAQAHLDEVVEALRLAAADPMDQHIYLRFADLRNLLQE